MTRHLKYYLTLTILFVILTILIFSLNIFSYLKISTIQSSLAEQKLRLDSLTEKEQILNGLDKRYRDIEKDIPKINTALPDKKEASQLLSDLDLLSNESGLKLTLLKSSSVGKKPTTPADQSLLQTNKGKYGYEMPLDIKIDGSFNNFNTFIQKLENYQRLVNISSVEITKPTDVQDFSDNIEAKLKITAYLKK